MANKAAAILEMMNKGMSNKEIRNVMKVSHSYLWKLRNQMAHKVEEPQPADGPGGRECHNECNSTNKKESLAEKIARQTKAWADAKTANVDTILDQRAEQYGSYMASANVAIRLKGIMHNAIAQQDLHLAPDQLLSLDMIAVKISRILTGNPSHVDSWLDIAGYAKLVADRLQGTVR
jgi:hypothetical protein